MPTTSGNDILEQLDIVYATGAPLRSGTVVSAVARAPRPPSEQEYFELTLEPIIDDTGKVLSVLTQCCNVTEAVHSEQAPQTTDERFRVFAQCMPSHVWSSRPDGYVDWFNDHTYSYTGYEPGTLYGDKWVETVHPDDRARAVAAWAHSVATGEPYRIQFRIRRADGIFRFFFMKADPVRNAVGYIEQWIGIDTDIDDEKRLGAELVALNASLEQQVTNRTRELMTSEAALRQSQKLEAIGQLTGGVAHDFNNLLVPIIGSLDALVRRGSGTEREQRLIDAALQSADRAKTLVERLLAFARRQPLQAVATDLKELVEGLIALVSTTVSANVGVHVNMATNLEPVRVDPNQLEMAILNLAANARDAMPEGGTLTIAAALESITSDHRSGLKPGCYVLLSLSDTGCGMDAATQARAVEPFFSTKGIGKGTGLGLSMAHGLVAQLGGALTIGSAMGHGTKIELWLPISHEPIGNKGSTTQINHISVPGRRRVLVVDDEALVRAAIADMLEEYGYEVVEVGSADQAMLIIADGGEFDIVLTDHIMPGMSGVDLARRLQANWPALPVLIVSGYADADGIASDLPHLTKPFSAAKLMQRLAELA